MTILILLSFLIQAVSGYLFGPSEVTGAVGGSVMVSCYYNPISANIHGRKFWCKVIKKQCITIMSTNNYIAQNYINRTQLQNNRDHFKINMTHLQKKDSGIYRCGIGNNNGLSYYVINVTVSEGNKIPYSSEVIIANLKGSITVNCPILDQPHTGWKYWCKMRKVNVPSCHIMVNSSGYVHPNFWGRVLIQEVSNTSDFKILVNNIKMNDFGFYRCGIGKFDDGSNWTDIHIHILNPTDKMRYQISKSFTRSPGELFVAQCQVPTSFNSVLLIYWCRWNETGCLRLIDSDGFIQKSFQNRISLNNTNKMSTIILTQLELGDTGYYWCVITDGQRVQTLSVEVHIIETTTALYSQVYIQDITTKETFSSAALLTTTSIPETHINVTFRPGSLENLTSTLNFNPTVLNTEMSKSRAEQENTTWLNQIGGASILQLTSIPATTHVQKTHLNVTFRPSDLENLPSTLNPNPTVLNPETSKSGAAQENTTWRHFITAENNQTGGASIIQLSAVPTSDANSIRESASTTSNNHGTGNIAEYISSFLPTSRDTHLTHSTPMEQETTEELYPRTSSRWQTSNTAYIPLIPISPTESEQETHLNPTVLNPETSESGAAQENTTWRHFITAENNQTGGASIVQLSAVPTSAANSIRESASTTSNNHGTGNIAETISSFLPRSRETHLTHSTPMEQETHLNVTLRPSDLENLPSTLDPNPTVLNPETSESGAAQENTTWRHFITAENNQTGGASIVQLSAVPTSAANSIRESASTTSNNHGTGNIAENISSFLPRSRETHLTHSTPMEQGIDHLKNRTPNGTYQLPGAEENYGITAVYSYKVTILKGNSTVEPQSKPGEDNSSSKSQVSNSKNLILILIPVLAISCVIGFATLISVVMNVRKKRATNNTIHRQENVSMMDRGAARDENTEQNELSVLELTNHSNPFGETEV